jgi:hypothetical protein
MNPLPVRYFVDSLVVLLFYTGVMRDSSENSLAEVALID